MWCIAFNTMIRVEIILYSNLHTRWHTSLPGSPTPESTPIWHWNENIEFDIDVCDIPRGARLCCAIYAIYGDKSKKLKKKRDVSLGRELYFRLFLQ